MKKLGYASLGLLGALLLALLVAPSFIDWNSYTRRLAQEFQAHTGHELEIAGNLELSLLPAPTLVAREVTLHKPNGEGLTHLASLGGLRARLAFWPLLTGELHLQSIRLSQAKIDILADESGVTNWDDLLARLGLRTQVPGSRGFGLVRLQDVRLEGAEISLQREGRHHRLVDLDAQLSAESLEGPWRAEGSFRSSPEKAAESSQEERQNFRLRMGQLNDKGVSTLALSLDILSAQAMSDPQGVLELDGRLAVKAMRFAGDLRWRGQNLAADLRRYAHFSLPNLLPGPYDLAARAEIDLHGLASKNLTLKTGTSSFAGRMDLAFGAPARLDLELSTGQLDLDALLAAAGKREKSATTAPADPADFLPLVGRVNLGVDVLIYRGQILRQLRLSADLLEDRTEVSQFYALLPGSTSLELAGTWWPQGNPETWDLDARFDLGSGNLRALLGWLELAPESVPANRLRRLSAQGRIRLKSDLVELTAVEMRLDQTRVMAAASFSLDERFGLGLRLDLDRLDLDAYGLAMMAERPDESGNDWLDLLRQALSLDPLLLQLADVNLDLAAQEVRQGGRAFGDLAVKATLLAGQFDLLEASIGALPQGGQFSASGQLLAKDPLTFTGDFSANLLAPERLAFWDALSLLGPASGPLELSGRAEVTAKEIKLEKRAVLQGGFLDLKGRIDLVQAKRPYSFQLAFEQEQAASLYALLNSVLAEKDLGRSSVRASARGDSDSLELADLEGSIGPLHLSGRLSFQRGDRRLALSKAALDLLLVHDDSETLAWLLFPGATKEYRLLKEGFGPVALRGSARLDDGKWRLEGLGGELGEVLLTGSAWLDLTRERPMVSLELAAGRFDWGAIENQSAEPNAPPGATPRWRLLLETLAALDGDFHIKLDEWSFGNWALHGAVLEAQVLAGLLDLKKLEAELSGGAITLAGKLDLSDRLEFDLSASADGVDPAPFLDDATNGFGGRGNLGLSARLSGSALSAWAFKKSLAGTLVSEGSLDLHPLEAPRIARYLEERLDPWLARQDGLAARFGQALEPFTGVPAELAAEWEIESGTLSLERTDLRRNGQSLTVNGQANLPARYMNLIMTLEGEKEGSLRLRGDFDEPALTVRGF